VGLTSTAIRTALGTRSCSRPTRFAVISAEKKIDAGRVAAHPGQASDKTHLDRVDADAEDDRIVVVADFGCWCSRIANRRRYNTHAAANEVSHKRWYLIVPTIKPVVLHISGVRSGVYQSARVGGSGARCPLLPFSERTAIVLIESWMRPRQHCSRTGRKMIRWHLAKPLGFSYRVVPWRCLNNHFAVVLASDPWQRPTLFLRHSTARGFKTAHQPTRAIAFRGLASSKKI
jgi:hypothetical protein